MSSFAQMKRNRASQFDKLNNELTKLAAPTGREEDKRFWQPTVDKAGNGYAIIRFLPAPDGEDVPFVRIFEHGFKAAGGWYIEKSLTTIGKADPVSEMNQELWATGTKENQDLVRSRKRKLQFISNIYVVKDPGNPENDGKVFLYKYGKKIFDRLNDLMHPEFEDVEAVNPFDLWEGCTFKMRIRKVGDFRNYDKSEFEDPSPLLDDDAALEEVWKQEYPLQEFLDPKTFKSYDELKARLDKVLSGRTAVVQEARETKGGGEGTAPWDEEDPVVAAPVPSKAKAAPKPASKAKPAAPTKEAATSTEDEGLDFYRNLVDEE